jgi:hypothetical protein
MKCKNIKLLLFKNKDFFLLPGVDGMKRLREHVESCTDSIGILAMSNVTGDTNLAVYSDLVSRAVKLARSFSEFSSLIDADQVI